MRQILSSGITGILVSHSVDQVQELCNKVLWIDHGVQIAFTDEVDLYCDAYQEFLMTKKLPGNREDIEKLADDYQERKKAEQEKKKTAETEKLKKILEQGSSDTAVRAAIRILEDNCPEALSEKYKKQEDMN